jgi:hypothetical protein
MLDVGCWDLGPFFSKDDQSLPKAFVAVALYRGVASDLARWKAQRIRERQQAAWLSHERTVAPTIERLALPKE